jgi:drug/metabolite transporter (DMT)-like permease
VGESLDVKKRTTLQPYVWMLTSCFAFSWMAIVANLAGTGCPWQIIALVRALVPLVLMTAWARYDGARLVFWGPPALWMRSIAGSCSLVGSFYTLTHMPPAEANCLANTFPIWVAFLSWPLLGDFPSRAVWLSAITGVSGVVLVFRPDIDGLNPTALVALAVSVFTAIAMMGLHRLKTIDPRAVVVHFSIVSAVFSAAAFVLLPTAAPARPFDWQYAGMLLTIGVTATIGQYFLTRAFTAGAPARVSVVCLTQVIFILALDVLLLGNVPDRVKLLGVLLILAPTGWIILRKPGRRLAVKPRDERSEARGSPPEPVSPIASVERQ